MPIDYTQYVRTNQFDNISYELRDFVSENSPIEPIVHEEGVQNSVLIFEIVRRKVEWRETGDRIRNPKDVYDSKYGDCEDQSILLASMIAATRLLKHVRFVQLRLGPNEGHVFPEIGIELSIKDLDDVLESIEESYSAFLNEYIGHVSYRMEHNVGRFDTDIMWIPADTTCCQYLGDIDNPRDAGYVRGPSDNWRWNNVHDVKEVPERKIVESHEYSR